MKMLKLQVTLTGPDDVIDAFKQEVSEDPNPLEDLGGKLDNFQITDTSAEVNIVIQASLPPNYTVN